MKIRGVMMPPFSDLINYWRERIPKDIIPFSDPGSKLALEPNGKNLDVIWTCRNSERQARFSVTLESGVMVEFLGRRLGYKSFLASSEMADLLYLAKMILQSADEQLFIPTKAKIGGEKNGQSKRATDLITEVVSNLSEHATRIIMITGDAGAGKTSVLKELVRKQAEAYLKGEAEFLYFYVNAQGRALARLTEAFATELQDLRATLTYHAVGSLVRAGILIPVIDGFDELIGVGGYDDAFSSLSRFIEELDGEGQIIASSRSTYYEEEFISRATSVSSLGGQVWTQTPIEILAWSDDEFESYVRRRHEASPDLVTLEEIYKQLKCIFSGKNLDLKQKPLFASKVIELLLTGEDLTGEDELLNKLIITYIERERREKLLDRNGAPLLSYGQIVSLLVAVAEEMWSQETRELDRGSIREIAEYELTIEGVSDLVQKVVIERMPNLAFLRCGERPGSIAFEHELFYSAFLARVIARRVIEKNIGMRLLLGRSAFPPEVPEIAIRTIAETSQNTIDILQIILAVVAGAGAFEGTRSAQVKENAGRLVSASLRWVCDENESIKSILVSNVIFPGGDLAGVRLLDSQLDSVVFRRTDLSRSQIINCEASNVMLYEVTVDPNHTRLEIHGIDPADHVFGLRVIGDEGVESIFDPEKVVDVLVKCGAIDRPLIPIPRRNIPDQYIVLLGKLMRTYGRANPVCLSDESVRAGFSGPEWAALKKLLIDYRIVTSENRATGGPPKEFLRRQILPDEFMTGLRRDANVKSNIRQFWEALERIIN